MKILRQHLPLLVMVGLAFVLRWWNYAYFPVGGETADEYAWTLLGSSLIQEREPSSWSYFLAYKDYHYLEQEVDGEEKAPIVRPAFDHPPLFSLLPGAAHSLKSFWLDSPSLKVIRAPMVLLGAVNVGFFYLVCRQIFVRNRWTVVGTSLFLTIPALVFSSRLVVAENLLITWILVTLLLVFSKQRRWTMPALIAVSALAVLTKIAGLIIPASLLTFGLLTKQPKLSKAAVWGGVLGIGLFAIYGAIYNWPLFLDVLASQSTRQLGLATLQNRLFLNPALVRHLFFDGWKMLGLFASFWLLAQPKKNKQELLVLIFTVISLLFVSLTVGESTFHGWYDFILWPSLVISTTLLGKTIWETKNGLLFGLVWLLLLPGLRLSLVFSESYDELSNLTFRLITLIGFLPLFWQLVSRPTWIRKTMLLLFIVLLTSNLVSVYFLTHDAYWLQADFFDLPR
jgi:hypothetical protein